MLEKFIKNCDFDAHFHLYECKTAGILDIYKEYCGISCAHSIEEWNIQKKYVEETGNNQIFLSYGMHPQNAANENISLSQDFLEKLLVNNEISFIGEIGFDFFTPEYKKLSVKQEEMFNVQIELAQKYNIPVVIHCRKANHKLFEYAKKLSLLPEVLFHSFMGPVSQAFSLLNKNINGYFSFGKQVFNGNKKVLECIQNLPPERVFAETDAPFQYLKGEKYTKPSEIKKIYAKILELQKS